MHIVFFMQDTGAVFGAERATLDLARGLRSAGEQVTFYLMKESRMAHADSGLLDVLHTDGFAVKLFPVSGRISLALARAVHKAFVEDRGDVLHVIGYKANVHAWLSRIHPVVATVHGWLFREDRKEKLYDAIDRWCLRRCDRVICLSTFYESLLLNEGISRGKLSLIPSGLHDLPSDTEVSARIARERPFTFGMMGRFSEEKNHDMFLRAAKIVYDQFPTCRFLIAGQGAQEGVLRAAASSLGLSEAIDFCGYMPVDDFMNLITVYVICSKIENLPYSILEAMAWSVPVIATRVGGIPDVVADGMNGWLVALDDVKGLAATMASGINNGPLVNQYGHAGREKLKREFSMSQTVARHLELYRTNIK